MAVPLTTENPIRPEGNETARSIFEKNLPPPCLYNAYVALMMLVVGFIGGILTLCVLNNKKLTKLNLCLYMRSLAVYDILRPLQYVIAEVVSRNVQRDNHPYWFVFLYLGQTFSWTSSWFIMAMSVEACIAVSLPHMTRFLLTRNRAIITILCISLCMPLLNIYILLSTEEDFRKFRFNMGLSDVLMYSIIPSLVIVPCNIIIVHVVRARRKMAPMSAQTHRNMRTKSEQSIVLMLVVRSVAFVVLTIPVSLYFVIYSYQVVKDPTIELVIIDRVYSSLHLNPGLNFFFYVLGGETFREAFIDMLRRWCLKSRPWCGKKENFQELQMNKEVRLE